MKDIKKIMRLDYISIKPYFTIKNLLIMLILYLVYFFMTKNPLIAISMPLLFAMMYSSYPFLVGDEAGIDSLYKIFGIKGDKVVKGRYAFALILFMAAIIIGLIFSIVASFFVKFDIKIVLPIVGSFFIVFVFLISMQYPLYFKYGYKKAKTLSAISFVVIALISLLSTTFRDYLKDLLNLMTNNKLISLLIVRLMLSGILNILNRDIEEIEDIKMAVTESLNICHELTEDDHIDLVFEIEEDKNIKICVSEISEEKLEASEDLSLAKTIIDCLVDESHFDGSKFILSKKL
ncbi:ABC-2 transporter permease [Peptoniphilus genitalis]